MNRCSDCRYFKRYPGSKDRYGVPLEPEEYECLKAEDMDEEEYEDVWINGNDRECSGYELAPIEWY